MKISVIIPSRGRAFRLWVAIGALQELASGKHQITYVIGCDEDDTETQNVCSLMRETDGETAYGVFKRMGSLGEMDNILARQVPADVYCVLGDDLQITTRDWDDIIAKAWEQKPDGVWWWSSKGEISALAPIISHKWFEAAGRLFTDYFPFWWDDLWLLEVWLLAAEAPPIFIDAYMRDRSIKTHRMRDLKFWSDFYQSRKPERVADAKRIAAALGWKLTGITEALGEQVFGPREEFLNRIDEIEKGQGEVANPPTPEYLKAKARAEALMTVPLAQRYSGLPV